MRHCLSDDQFRSLWSKVKSVDGNTSHMLQTFTSMSKERYKLWGKYFHHKYKLLYSEVVIDDKLTGCVIGTEDRINWFLLNV